jgi:nitrile hydratase
MHGFGRIAAEPNEPVFHERWEGRVFALNLLAMAAGLANIDQSRHAIERLDPVEYLTAGYYGRWLSALELLIEEAGGIDAAFARATPGAADARREIDAKPGFRVGDAVLARNVHPAGHTRLPRYVRGRRGTVVRVQAAWVFPDAHAHGRGENPQYVYAVRFDGRELWGESAEPGTAVHVDLFESYLEPAPGTAP